MKTLKDLLGWLLVTLLLLQLIQIRVPEPPKASKADEIKAPKEVMEILRSSCYDCHSNHTKWPWYSKISPISLEVNSHVKNGRAWLNFSIWNRYSKEKQKKLYQDIEDAINLRMPPANYLWVHKESRLKRSQRDLIKEWARKEQEKLK
jgi:hypothetical protein